MHRSGVRRMRTVHETRCQRYSSRGNRHRHTSLPSLLHVPRRSSRRGVRDNKTRKWAERSVWSMVCAIELGLIEPPAITSSARKLKTKGRKPGWPGKRSTYKGSVPKSSTSTVAGSRLMKSHETNPWLRHNQPTGRIKLEEYHQNRLPFFEHRYSLPPENTNLPDKGTSTIARNIYYNGEKSRTDKTTVYNPFNVLRGWFKKSNRGIRKDSEVRHTNDSLTDDQDTEPREFKRKRIFTKHARNSALKERSKYGSNKAIPSTKRVPQKRRYFPRKQGDSAGLKQNRFTGINAEVHGEGSSKRAIPVARVRPQSGVFQDSAESNIYDFKRVLENQSRQLSSSSEESSESDDYRTQDFPKERRSKDPASRRKLYSQRDKRVKATAAKKVPRKRRYYREPLCSRSNKENKSSIESSTEENSKKGDDNVDDRVLKEKRERRLSCGDGKCQIETISLREEVAVRQANSKIDYEDSEVDETLLVNPSTDLPGTFFESDERNNEIVDLNLQFDVNFDLNFEAHAISTTLDASFDRDDAAKDIGKVGKVEAEFSEYENDEIKKAVRKLSFSAPSRKRRSADSIVSTSSTEDKENRSGNNSADTINNKVGRVTRGSVKNCVEKEIKKESWPVGTVVWGSCMGWWPGLVVDAEDVGMCCSEGKSWIFWIGEHRISHLKDKTQIQPFSTGLRSRLIETFRMKTPKDANYAACLATVKLLNDQILQRGPLTRPYHAWVEKHLISHENIDQLILHPYPPNVQKRLDELKKENADVTEKYLSEVNESSEKTTRSNVTAGQKGATKPNVSTDPGHLPLADQKPGVITWAKIMGQIWWPAMIIDFRDCGMKEPNFGCQWILWYGDYTLSEVNHQFFLAFEKGMLRMKEYAMNCKREVYRRGVVDAAKDFCSRFGYKTEEWTLEEAFEWFSKLEDDEEASTLSKNVLPGIPGGGASSQTYPSRIVEGLRKHKGNCTVAAIRKHNIKDSETLKSVMSGSSDLNALCLMCLKNCEETERIDHPFFEGALCEECSEKYTPTIFAYGDDGKCFFCTVCAGSDTVVMCDEHDCPRVYCTACLKYLIAPNTYDEIMLNDPFLCFLCEDSPALLLGGLLKPRADWRARVTGLFHGKRDSLPNQVEFYKGGRKKLRVLSLFDGISSGLVVLNKLGIHVEAYYASEIDPDAEMVSSAHFGEQIVRLGDVRTITEEKIREIAPIHLLIGGSPCNDLSLVNPVRLGPHDPNGSGILVFEYCRVKNLVQKANGEEHFFWLFENVAAMPSKYRLEINGLLGREPDLIDAANYSPQHRPRLYWSNFPIVSYPLSSQDLQDVLTPNCNRHALVKKIRTVTTRVNSLKQGKQSLKPILMNEENDSLWITELEEIFGFPRHYTDVKNLCATKRQKLIGMSWSIQTIAELMRPLCNFFQGRDQDSP